MKGFEMTARVTDFSSEDTFDSREVIERIEELETEIGTNPHPDDFVMEREELAALLKLKEDAATNGWSYGVTFIAEDYFTTYAEELARDLDLINADAAWPANHIDWEAAAAELLVDYSEVELDGDTFYYRA